MTDRAGAADRLKRALAYGIVRLSGELARGGVELPFDIQTWATHQAVKRRGDFSKRDAFEKKLARELGELLGVQLDRLLELLGDPPDISKVPDTFWDDIGQETAEALRPFLRAIYLADAREILSEIPVGIDWTAVNRAASDWASRYTFSLVRGVTDTSREQLRESIASYYERAMTREELESLLRETFGEVRAEMIAVTETTRAAAEGENEVRVELEQEGIQMVSVWNTNRDELVCPICGPMNERHADGYRENKPYWIHPESGEDLEIPPHPRCRCWETLEFPE